MAQQSQWKLIFKANLSQPLIAQSFGVGSMVASGFPFITSERTPPYFISDSIIRVKDDKRHAVKLTQSRNKVHPSF